MEELYCHHCDIVVSEPVLERRELPNGAFQVRANCPKCGHYLKFMPQGGPELIHFGKYKDKTVEEVAEADPEYLRWLYEQPWCKRRLKEAIAKALGFTV
jgi:hypothetical protein